MFCLWNINLFSHEITADNIDLPRNDQLTSWYIPQTDMPCLGTIGQVCRAQCTLAQRQVLGSNPDKCKGILSGITLFLFHSNIWLYNMLHNIQYFLLYIMLYSLLASYITEHYTMLHSLLNSMLQTSQLCDLMPVYGATLLEQLM